MRFSKPPKKGPKVVQWRRMKKAQLKQHAEWLKRKSLPMDRTKLKIADWSWGYGLTHEWTDMPFKCRDCGKQDVWKAADQKTYYEVWGRVYREQRAVRCGACRAAIRENNARTLEGLKNQPGDKRARLSPSKHDRYATRYRMARPS